jgi:hypothetical protein
MLPYILEAYDKEVDNHPTDGQAVRQLVIPIGKCCYSRFG